MTEQTANALVPAANRRQFLAACAGLAVEQVLAHPHRAAAGMVASPWRDTTRRAMLRNDALEASFQAGMLFRLKDRATGKMLLSIDPDKLPSNLVVFDDTPINLDTCRISQEVTHRSVVTRFTAPDGHAWEWCWSIGPGAGDLILQASGASPQAVEEFRALLLGCDLADHGLVWINNMGAGEVIHAPWDGVLLGDPQKDGIPSEYVQPLVALFEGKSSGWFLEGRDLKLGPSNVMIAGKGNTVNVGMVRRFLIPTKTPQLYEIRLRTYQKQWPDAVDPYIKWMEQEAGFVPLEKRNSAWIRDITNDAVVEPGDFPGLENLAKRMAPPKTAFDRNPNDWYHTLDDGYPDYRIKPAGKEWFRRARALGFHATAWFNSNGVCTDFPGWQRFKSGFAVVGKDAQGNDLYESIYNGRFIRCSSACKPFRDYLIGQMKESVDAGADIIYLDEAFTPCGKLVVDGVTAFEGRDILMREILERYPHVALATEQLNPLTAKYGALPVSYTPLGHPLSGYIFHRFAKILPDGVMFAPVDMETIDAFASWGYMVPGASPGHPAWMETVTAFQRYDLAPDIRLPHREFTQFRGAGDGGIVPVADYPLPPEGVKLFGYRGRDGVVAYFEKKPHQFGLVLYEPGQSPQWVGTRYFGLTSYAGGGLPVYTDFRYTVRDWLIYDGHTLLGLDPKNTYWFDKTLRPSAKRFHVTKIPADFAGIIDWNARLPDQEVGDDDAYFMLRFGGHGMVAMHVPAEYDVYLNGDSVPVNRATASATARVNATADRPAVLLAVRRSDRELVGSWLSLPWKASKDSLRWLEPNQGIDGFSMSVGGIGWILGRLPAAKSIRLQGAYQEMNGMHGPPGDGVVRLNGKEVLRVPHGERPYKVHQFDADISSFAGQAVLLEFLSDGWSGRQSAAEWISPRITAAGSPAAVK